MPSVNEKSIRIYFEIPEGYIDYESPLLWAGASIQQEIQREIRGLLIKQYLTKVELPEITFTPEEVKDRVLTILAERTVEKLNT